MTDLPADFPPVPPAVIFDFVVFTARYPEFAGLSAAQAQGYFNEAGIYCANDACNPAFRVGILPTLLNMLTAHIAWLYAPRGPNGQAGQVGQPASPIVGHISNATEGSITVAADIGNVTEGSPSQAWYMQSSYGASYWYATARYRTAIYRSPYRGIQSFGYRRDYGGYGRGWN